MGTIQQCRPLSELIRVLAFEIDQPLDEEGQMSWQQPAEFHAVANEAYRELFRQGDALDIQLNRISTNVTPQQMGIATPTTTFFFLPTNLRALIAVKWLGATDRETRHLREGSDYDIEPYVSQTDAIFEPKSRTGLPSVEGRPRLMFNRAVSATQKFKVVYTYHPLPLIYGVVLDAGSTTVKLGEHESYDTGYLNSVYGNIWKGTGAGQQFTIGSWDGPTQTATLSGGTFNPIPDETSWYDSRPDLHPDMEQAFIQAMKVKLASKLHDERGVRWTAELQDMLSKMAHRLKTLNRRAQPHVRDDLPWSHSDPYHTGWYS